MLKIFFFLITAFHIRIASAQGCEHCSHEPLPAASAETGIDPRSSLAMTEEFYSNLINMRESDWKEHDVSTASVKIGADIFYFNTAFWRFAEMEARIVIRKFNEECGDCIVERPEYFKPELKDVGARTYLSRWAGGKAVSALEHTLRGSAYVGARWGKMAFTAKIAGEGGETLLSIFAGGGGLHLFCTLIDLGVIFSAEGSQATTQVALWAPNFEVGRFATFMRWGLAAAWARDAKNSVRFVAGPFEIDEEGMRQMGLEGPTKTRWFRANTVNRVKLVNDLLNLQDKQDLKNKANRGMVLDRRRAMGKGLRLLWKAPDYVAGKSPMDKIMRHGELWVMQVQESVLQPSLKQSENVVLSPQPPNLAETEAEPNDPIRLGLAQEFAKTVLQDPAAADRIEKYLMDVELIANPKKSRALRLTQLRRVQSILLGLYVGAERKILANRGELYQREAETLYEQLKAVFPAVGLEYQTLGITAYIDSWRRGLLFMALEKRPEVLVKKRYEMMEGLLRILKYFKTTQSLLDASTAAHLDEFKKQNKADLEELYSYVPWLEKRKGGSLIPFRYGMPECSELDRAVE